MTRLFRQPAAARFVLIPAVVSVLMVPPAIAQTPIERHSNSFSPEQDVKLGQEAASEIRREMPMLNDGRTDDFIDRIGDRLIEHIPSDFRQPAFRYSFDVVNLRDINAFALPGGPMFVHRGMIEAARSEGEVAGVMAHEIAHVTLRHGTVQATRGQKFQLGAIAGQVLGAVIGGRTGAVVSQGSEIGLGTYFLKYGREFEREADLLGAQIMAGAGYDPRAMASMFQTIERQGGGGGPEFLSGHPNPGNRVEAINREAAMLRGTRGRTRRHRDGARPLRQLPPAPTSAQAATGEAGAAARAGRHRPGPTARVDQPSGEWRTYQPGDFLRISVPANWQQVGGGDTVTFTPDGGYVRARRPDRLHPRDRNRRHPGGNGSNLQQQTEQLLQGFAQSNPQLRRQGGYSRTSVGGRQGLTTTLSNVSEVTGETEAVNVSTVQLAMAACSS